MKIAYFYDKNGRYTSYDAIADNAPVPENATLNAPYENGVGLFNPVWNGEKWVGLNFDKKPNSESKLAANLTKQIMQLQLANQQQQEAAAMLTKQLMALQLKGVNA